MACCIAAACRAARISSGRAGDGASQDKIALLTANARNICSLGRPPDFDWDAVRNEAVSILNCKGEFDKRKPGWTCKARLEDHLMKFCFDEFGKEPVHSMLCVKISDWFPGLKDGRRKSRKVEK
jgi:hypothetical protein